MQVEWSLGEKAVQSECTTMASVHPFQGTSPGVLAALASDLVSELAL